MRALGLAALILSTLLVGTSAPLRVAVADTPVPSQRSITVSGEGTVYVSPDEAFVTVGVQQTDLQATKAQAAANTVTAAAIARIKALGVADQDIQTVGISLDPQYDDRGTVIGFVASDTLSVTVKRPRQAGAVIDAGVGAGANRNVSVRFGLKNDSQARSAALRAAVAQGQQKAVAVAAQLGLALQGAKIQVAESVLTSPVPVVYAQPGLAAPSRASGGATPVQTGSLTIADSVTMTYTF